MFTLCMPHKSSIFVPAIPQPAIPPPTSTTYDPNHQCTKCMLTPGGPALCPDAHVLTPFFSNIAVEPFTGPPQAGSRRAAPQQSRVSPGRAARGGAAYPSGQSSPYVHATVPPRARPPPRGLRSRAVLTVYLTSCPLVCQVPNNKAPRRLPRSSACSRKQSALTIPGLLICYLLFVVYFCYLE
jgi:hypothetical protein